MDLEFLLHIPKLKETLRTGWLERGVQNAESVADHSFMSAFIALMTAPAEDRLLGKRGISSQAVSRDRVAQMLLVHDFHESVTGDMVSKSDWEGGTHSQEEKRAIEYKAASNLLPPSLLPLWLEFHEQKTSEAQFAREIDKLEMVLQAIHYKKMQNHQKPMEPFWDQKNQSHVKSPGLKRILEDAISGRESGLLKLFNKARKLKEFMRSGWITDSIEQPESVAGHCFGAAFLALCLAPSGMDMDKDKAVRMALLHDIGEAIIGDILVDWKVNWLLNGEARRQALFKKSNHKHGITQKEKEALEADAIEKLSALDTTGMIKQLFLEFESKKSQVSAFGHATEKLDMALQALHFELSGATKAGMVMDHYFHEAY